MKIGGPIEAMRLITEPDLLTAFPPMKIGGPIEAWHPP